MHSIHCRHRFCEKHIKSTPYKLNSYNQVIYSTTGQVIDLKKETFEFIEKINENTDKANKVETSNPIIIGIEAEPLSEYCLCTVDLKNKILVGEEKLSTFIFFVLFEAIVVFTSEVIKAPKMESRRETPHVIFQKNYLIVYRKELKICEFFYKGKRIFYHQKIKKKNELDDDSWYQKTRASHDIKKLEHIKDYQYIWNIAPTFMGLVNEEDLQEIFFDNRRVVHHPKIGGIRGLCFFKGCPISIRELSTLDKMRRFGIDVGKDYLKILLEKPLWSEKTHNMFTNEFKSHILFLIWVNKHSPIPVEVWRVNVLPYICSTNIYYKKNIPWRMVDIEQKTKSFPYKNVLRYFEQFMRKKKKDIWKWSFSMRYVYLRLISRLLLSLFEENINEAVFSQVLSKYVFWDTITESFPSYDDEVEVLMYKKQNKEEIELELSLFAVYRFWELLLKFVDFSKMDFSGKIKKAIKTSVEEYLESLTFYDVSKDDTNKRNMEKVFQPLMNIWKCIKELDFGFEEKKEMTRKMIKILESKPNSKFIRDLCFKFFRDLVLGTFLVSKKFLKTDILPFLKNYHSGNNWFYPNEYSYEVLLNIMKGKSRKIIQNYLSIFHFCSKRPRIKMAWRRGSKHCRFFGIYSHLCKKWGTNGRDTIRSLWFKILVGNITIDIFNEMKMENQYLKRWFLSHIQNIFRGNDVLSLELVENFSWVLVRAKEKDFIFETVEKIIEEGEEIPKVENIVPFLLMLSIFNKIF